MEANTRERRLPSPSSKVGEITISKDYDSHPCAVVVDLFLDCDSLTDRADFMNFFNLFRKRNRIDLWTKCTLFGSKSCISRSYRAVWSTVDWMWFWSDFGLFESFSGKFNDWTTNHRELVNLNCPGHCETGVDPCAFQLALVIFPAFWTRFCEDAEFPEILNVWSRMRSS